MPVGIGLIFRTPGMARISASFRTPRLDPPIVGGRATTAVSIPGSWTSIPNVARPVTFSAPSTRFTDVPMIRNREGSLSGTFSGGVWRAASSARSP